MAEPQTMAELMANKERTILIENADRFTSEGFTQVPNFVLRNKTLSSNAKLVYAGLLSYAWQKDSCFPGQERLGRDLGLSRRTVVTVIQELEKSGFLELERRGQGKTNLYILKQNIANVDK